MVLFQIGALDITPFIVLNSYQVSSQPDYDTWFDGNRTERRGVKRKKLKGSFSVKFFSQKDYRDFLNAIETNKTTGDYIYVTVYDNKLRNVKTTNVFMDYEPIDIEPSIGWSFDEETEITITER